MKTTHEIERILQAAAIQLRDAIKRDLDQAKKNLSPEDYSREIRRIAWVNRSNVSSSEAHSTTNLAQKIWRQEAIERIYRGEDL